jgi:hypothetical protein
MTTKEKFFLAVIAIVSIVICWNIHTPESNTNSNNININFNIKSEVPTSVNGVPWTKVMDGDNAEKAMTAK